MFLSLRDVGFHAEIYFCCFCCVVVLKGDELTRPSIRFLAWLLSGGLCVCLIMFVRACSMCVREFIVMQPGHVALLSATYA